MAQGQTPRPLPFNSHAAQGECLIFNGLLLYHNL
jgi:hypothetical protein